MRLNDVAAALLMRMAMSSPGWDGSGSAWSGFQRQLPSRFRRCWGLNWSMVLLADPIAVMSPISSSNRVNWSWAHSRAV